MQLSLPSIGDPTDPASGRWGTFKELFTEFKSLDPLQFIDTEAYAKRLENAKKNSGRDEGAMVGPCKILGKDIALGVLDFSFMAGSMGSVVGERLTSIIEYAIAKQLPLVIVSASGGARMQESALSLMQMAKTSNIHRWDRGPGAAQRQAWPVRRRLGCYWRDERQLLQFWLRGRRHLHRELDHLDRGLSGQALRRTSG